MKREYIGTGKTVDEAIEAACAALGCERSEIEFEILALAKKSFFGLRTTPAQVKVTWEDGTPEPRANRPQEGRREKKAEKPAEPQAEKKPEKKAPAESVYTVSELAGNARSVFGTMQECVVAALKTDGKAEYTVSEAKEIVSKFLQKEVK